MWYNKTPQNSVIIYALLDWIKDTYQLSTTDLADILNRLKKLSSMNHPRIILKHGFFNIASLNSIELNFHKSEIKIRWNDICITLITKP